MTLWALGTVGHFLLTARWLTRGGGAVTRDELWFQTMVAGTGTLLITLHLLASTTGLTVWRVLFVLLAGHAIVAGYVGRPFRGAELARLKPRPTVVVDQSTFVTRALEVAAMVVLTAVVMQWSLVAAATAGVSGSDAAHYHVPNAVNLALGASPFDLPATSHLYPMGSSTLAAWFILPLQTTMLTDLVMVLPFLLLVSAAGWLFRQLASLSGLAWCTWMLLALFGTPLFRSASLMSADLVLAAASMALAAALLTPLIQRQLKPADVWLIALSLGLLLGAKVTGIVVAGLLGIPALLLLSVRSVRRARASARAVTSRAKARDLRTAIGAAEATPYGIAWALIGAAVAVIGAGGIWLVRNWWVWGSPVAPNGVALFGITVFPGAPYEATTYLSVLGDMSEKPGYHLWDRTRHFINVWLSSWYALGLGALALIPIDVLASWKRGNAASTRLWVMLVACITGAVLTWFLIGAPWTSLEWTEGFSLRYALPWLALLPVVAWIGFFPASLPWYRRTALSLVGGLAISVGGLMIFGRNQEVEFPPLPTLTIVLAALALIGAWRAFVFAAPRWTAAFVASAVFCVSIVFGTWVQSNARALETVAAARAGGPRTLGDQIYDSVIAFEATDRGSCDSGGRRFFVTNRFDQAGALQGARLTNRVFYAAREVRVTARVRPAMGLCDYLITERAIMDTDKGAALHAALNTSGTLVEVATVGDVVVLVHR